MRIAFTIDRLDPGKGGAEAYLARFGEWLADRGHQVAVFVRAAALPEGGPIDVVRVSAARWPRGRAEKSFAVAAARRAGAMGAQAVLAVRHAAACTVYQPHGGLHFETRQSGAESRGIGVDSWRSRVSATLPGKHRAFRELERNLLGGVRPPHFIAMSRRIEFTAIGRYPRLEGMTTVVPNGVDLERFHPRLRDEARNRAERELDLGARPLLLFLAHNPRLKGIVPLLHALAVAGGPAADARLAVAGRGTERFSGLASKLGLADRTTFLGRVPDATSWLAAADALVHPTYHDPCSLVALEAMACGTAVITTERNGVSELMTDADPQCGVVIPEPGDRDALVAAIERLSDRDAARIAGERARTVAKGHPWERGFKSVEAIMARTALSTGKGKWKAKGE